MRRRNQALGYTLHWIEVLIRLSQNIKEQRNALGFVFVYVLANEQAINEMSHLSISL